MQSDAHAEEIGLSVSRFVTHDQRECSLAYPPRVAYDNLRKRPGRVSDPPAVRDMARLLGGDSDDRRDLLALLCRVKRSAVDAWINGEGEPSPQVAERLLLVHDASVALLAVLTVDGVALWWETPTYFLEHATPAERLGDSDAERLITVAVDHLVVPDGS